MLSAFVIGLDSVTHCATLFVKSRMDAGMDCWLVET